MDDGAANISVSLAMARAAAADGITVVACTPHILPGLYHNTGPPIRQAVAQLQDELDQEGIALRLTAGADNHMVPDFIAGIRSGRLLTLGDTRYVLVEPPHHVAPPRLQEFFFNLTASGYVPILTHPERLSWLKAHYSAVCRLVEGGAWMQITGGSLTGAFGRNAQYWAERMLDEGRVHILATDAHDLERRPLHLSKARDFAAARVGPDEAEHLVVTRPRGVLQNVSPSSLPSPAAAGASSHGAHARVPIPPAHFDDKGFTAALHDSATDGQHRFAHGLRRFFD